MTDVFLTGWVRRSRERRRAVRTPEERNEIKEMADQIVETSHELEQLTAELWRTYGTSGGLSG